MGRRGSRGTLYKNRAIAGGAQELALNRLCGSRGKLKPTFGGLTRRLSISSSDPSYLLLLKKADGSGRVAVNEILIANAAVSAIIREGATQKLQDVIISGKGQGMQFMDDAIWSLLQQGIVTPHEAFMKAIDKNRFKKFLPPEEEHLGDAAGAVPDDEQHQPGDFVKKTAARTARK